MKERENEGVEDKLDLHFLEEIRAIQRKKCFRLDKVLVLYIHTTAN